MYTAQSNLLDVPGGTAELFVKLTINGTPYTIYRRSYVGIDPVVDGIALNYQINLNEGDIIAFTGAATEPEVQYVSMAVLIIDKLP